MMVAVTERHCMRSQKCMHHTLKASCCAVSLMHILSSPACCQLHTQAHPLPCNPSLETASGDGSPNFRTPLQQKVYFFDRKGDVPLVVRSHCTDWN